jgi:hypothetical protein
MDSQIKILQTVLIAAVKRKKSLSVVRRLLRLKHRIHISAEALLKRASRMI